MGINHDTSSTTKVKLLVLVLSAREHFYKRSVFREAVVLPALEKYSTEVEFRFLIGEFGCRIPMNYRVPYTCSLKEPLSTIPFAEQSRFWLDFCYHDLALAEENDSLREEVLQYRDMVFLGLTDVYKTLSRKVLFGISHAVSDPTLGLAFDWLLKVDDDTFVDVHNLISALKTDPKLQAGNPLVDKIYWSKFAIDAPVLRKGKWAEHLYSARVYPAFGFGGGGYVLSHAACSWISRNKDDLQEYQGEDVSIGIWMAAVNVKYIHDAAFHAFQCTEGMYTFPHLAPQSFLLLKEMRKFHGYRDMCVGESLRIKPFLGAT